jgi:hypothetical protein
VLLTDSPCAAASDVAAAAAADAVNKLKVLGAAHSQCQYTVLLPD